MEVLLQFLKSLCPLAHLLRLDGRFGSSWAQARLPCFTLAVLEAVRLELDFIPFIQDGLHLQAVLKGTGHVERSGAVLYRALWSRKGRQVIMFAWTINQLVGEAFENVYI